MDNLLDNQIPSLLERMMTDGGDVSEDEILSTFTKLIEGCRVPKLVKAEDMPYDFSDFPDTAQSAKCYLDVISRLLEELTNLENKERIFTVLFKRNVVVNSLLVASEYTDLEWEWSSECTSVSAKNVIDRLCQFTNCETAKELLGGEDKNSISNSEQFKPNKSNVDYLEYTLQTLTKGFNKKSWKSSVGSKASYRFILLNLDPKKLGDSLSYLLPPALFIVDDWEEKNKILGLSCLHHILRNTTGSEVRWYGRAEVIFEAIKDLLHSREIKVLEILYPTIILNAKILEDDPQHTGHLRSKSSYDIIMQQLLQEMRYEQKLALRITYSSILPDLLSSMGIAAVKWSNEIIPMCDDYLSTFSGPLAEDRINILKALQVYVRNCWPQIHVNAASILKMIIRLMYDVTEEESGLDIQVKEVLAKEGKEVVRLLHAAAPKTTQDLYEGVAGSVDVHPECKYLLEEIGVIVSCKL